MRLRSHAKAERARQQARQQRTPTPAPAPATAPANTNARQNPRAPQNRAQQQNASVTVTATTAANGPCRTGRLGRTGSLVVTNGEGQPLGHCDVVLGPDGVHTLDREGRASFTSAESLAGARSGSDTETERSESFRTAPTHPNLDRFTTPAPRHVPDIEELLRAPARPNVAPRPDLGDHRVFFLEGNTVAEIPLERLRAPPRTEAELLRVTHAEALRHQLRQVMQLNDEDLFALRENDVMRTLWNFHQQHTETLARTRGLGPEGTFLCNEAGELLNPALENAVPASHPPAMPSFQGLQASSTPCPSSARLLRSPFHHQRPVNPEHHRQGVYRHPRGVTPPMPSPSLRRPVRQSHPQRPASQWQVPPTPTPARNGAEMPERMARLLQQESTQSVGQQRYGAAVPVLMTDENGAGPSSAPVYFRPVQTQAQAGGSRSQGRRAAPVRTTAPLRRTDALADISEAESVSRQTLSTLTQTTGDDTEDEEDYAPQARGKGKGRAA